MRDQAISWFQGIDWPAVLMAAHFTGLGLALAAAFIGHIIGVQTLLQAGPRLRRLVVSFLQTCVVAGLALLWASGIARLDGISFPSMPDAMVVKIGVTALLSVNVLFVQAFVLPLMRRRRPVAAHTTPGELIGCAVISCVSASCWLMLAAINFSDVLDDVSLATSCFLLAAFVVTLTAGCIALSLGVRAVTRRYEAAASAVQSATRPQETLPVMPARSATERLAADQSANRSQGSDALETMAPRVVPFAPRSRQADLAQRFRQTMAGQRLGVDGGPKLRDRLAEPAYVRGGGERQPVTEPLPEAATGPRMVAVPGEDAKARAGEDQLLHKWLATGFKKEVPTEPTAPDDDDEGETLSLGKVKAACRRAMLGAGAVSFFSNMLMLTGPLFMLQIYDRVLTSKSLPTLAALFVLAVALFVFMAVLDLIRSRLLVRVGLRIDRSLGGQVFQRAVEVAEPEHQAGRLQLQKDVQHIRQFVSGAGITAIFDMPWAPLYFGIVLMFHWMLGAVALVGAAILIVTSLLNDWLSRKPVSAASKFAAESDRIFEAGRRNGEVLQAMGMMPRFRQRWLDMHCAELLQTTKAADIAGLLSVITKTTRLILQSAMLAAGAFLVLGGEVSPGVMIASSIIMSRALAPVELAISHWRGFIAARQGLRRLGQEFASSGESTKRLTLPVPEGRVHVDNVFAGPIGVRDPVIKGLAFRLEPGDALGVLGPSGSGKSTLARVLVGIWPTVRGRVALDGAPIEHWRSEQLGRHIGYLPQDASLFSGTVAENIARFDKRAEASAIIAAAEAANVHKMILSLPHGYNTMVGEGGAVLSGGQRQRIALARALYGQPALIVLDEPNSNLDGEGEAALAEAIRTMRAAGRAVVVMAHRRKALEHVNLILVLNDGRQAAFGAKEDVLKVSSKSTIVRKRGLHAAE